ncbi:DNA glycosylase [Whalleya microplaca]|nr:DNA glycosylase [Whalleya microplaca]
MGTDNNEEAITTEETLAKEPSFKGRLQLEEFMFADTTSKAAVSGTRRSLRLSQPTASPSHSHLPSTQELPSESPSRPNKRKKPTSTSKDLSPTPTTTPTTPSPKKKKPRRPAPSYAPPSTYAHLPHLPDAIAPNLLILFIGLNPGVQTARTGHAYAHPSNLFWKLLYSSGITPVPCTATEDRGLPERFALGLTNIVARPSRSGAELSAAEMDAGVGALEAKCARWRPEVACVVGKSIWESIFRVRRGRKLGRGEFAYGWQEDRLGVVGDGDGDGDGEEKEGWEGSRVFVASSTSGLAATLRPEEKERIWKVLGDWCVERRKEREREKEKGDVDKSSNEALEGI